MMSLIRAAALAGLLLAGTASLPAAAVDSDDLLPVDQAFALSAQTAGRDRIDIDWKIAPGYYLYRHRTSVKVEGGGFQAQPLQLPAGDRHQDEFFGEVETYRDHLQARLPGRAEPAARTVSLTVKYQGCADLGICYPPQTRTLKVALPAAAALDAGSAAFTPLVLPGAKSSLTGGARAGMDAAPLPPEQAFQLEAIALDGNQLLLRFTPAKGYYLYRDRTSMRLRGVDGITVQAPRWPRGSAYHDAHFGDVTVYFDQVEVPVPLQRSHAKAARGRLQVTFQGCQTDGICYPPMTRELAVDIPAGTPTPAAVAATPPVNAAATVPADPADTATATTAAAMDASVEAATAAADAEVQAQEVPRTLPPAAALRQAERDASPLWLALLLALGGGLILNLMPCLLPVLSLKALSLADGSQPRRHALWYTAGVLVSFLVVGALVLALRAAGQALGWGFQLQQPAVVAGLGYVMFAVGLSLSGVFALGYGLAGTGAALSRRGGPWGDFFTGVLAVVVASPCTAPFMGAALAYAFTAPPLLALLVFAALGLGLALPFLLIGFVPALAQRLPRPGAWMDTLKQVLAFPMYLTAIWLLWVLGKQRGIDAVALALVGMTVLALGLWWWQRLSLRQAPVQRLLAVLVLVAALLPLALIHRLPVASAVPVATSSWQQAYSADALAQLRREGRVVFVDMTADWCVTCKANEKAVLSQPAFEAAMQRHDAVLMTGDWTNVDPAITAFLESHGAVGVPLYVVYPADGGDGEVLPTVLTQGIVDAALARAGGTTR